MGVLVLIFRFLMANVLTCFYSSVVRTTYFMEDINNPPKPTTVQVPLKLQANCIDPKYGEHIYLKVNDIYLHCVISGNESNPLMMLVHGFPEFWYSWRYQILHYQQKYRVVACDLRGFGDSDKPLSVAQYRINYIVEDLKGVVDALGYKKVILICHDWGGIICNRLRETYPGYVTALIGLSTTSLDAWFHEIWNSPDQRKKSGYFFLYRHCSVPEMRLTRNNLTIIDKFLIAPGKTTVTRDDVECYKYWFGQPGAFTYAVNLYRANFQLYYSKAKFNDSIPSTCVLGSNEVALTEGNLAFLNSTYANMKTAVILNVGHFMIQQDPDIVNAYVDQFLALYNL